MDEDVRDVLVGLVKSCWRQEQGGRPPMTEVCSVLNWLLSRL